MISLCNANKFSFHISNNNRNEIQDGSVEIRQVLGPTFYKFKRQFQKHSIMFVDQLSTVDGRILHNWKTITQKTFTTHTRSTSTPIWFKTLEQQILSTFDGTRILKPQFVYPVFHFKGTQILQPPLGNRAKD